MFSTPLWIAAVASSGGGQSDVEAPALVWTIAADGLSADGVSSESLNDSVALDLADFTFSAPSGTAPGESSISYQTTTNVNDTVRVVFATPWYESEGAGITVDVAAGAVEDLAGNQIASVTGGAVANESTAWPLSANGAAYSPEEGTLAGFLLDRSPNANNMSTIGVDPTIDAVTFGAPVVDFSGTQGVALPAAVCSAITGGDDLPASWGAGLRIENDASRPVLLVGPAPGSSYGLYIITITLGRLQGLRRDATLALKSVNSTGSSYPINTWSGATALIPGTTLAFQTGLGSAAGIGDVDVGAVSSTSTGYAGYNGSLGFVGQLGRMWIDAENKTGRELSVLQKWVDDYTTVVDA